MFETFDILKLPSLKIYLFHKLNLKPPA